MDMSEVKVGHGLMKLLKGVRTSTLTLRTSRDLLFVVSQPQFLILNPLLAGGGISSPKNLSEDDQIHMRENG